MRPPFTPILFVTLALAGCGNKHMSPKVTAQTAASCLQSQAPELFFFCQAEDGIRDFLQRRERTEPRLAWSSQGPESSHSCCHLSIGPRQPKMPTLYAVEPRLTSWTFCWLAGFSNVGLYNEKKPQLSSFAFSKSRQNDLAGISWHTYAPSARTTHLNGVFRKHSIPIA